ncbi:MAG: tRNA 2-thiouridine(34) synthase MnmA [Flavobacteriales bacterium]
MERVVVGLSGGVDSSVAAYLLKEQGYEVIGLFMRNWNDASVTLEDECPWVEDSADAMLVAEKIGIPFQVIDLSEQYRERIVNYMFAEYEKGRTPNPDILCNREIKFDVFLKTALELGADYVATGHYCQKQSFEKEGKKIHQLIAGADQNKDQSYFLCQLNQFQLSKALFPIGHLKKSKVREIARKLNLITADKKDSQGLCFIGHISLPQFLQQKLKPKEGAIIEIEKEADLYNRKMPVFESKEEELHYLSTEIKYTKSDGKIVGKHQGAHYFTNGQRKGLGVGGTIEPLFVIKVDVNENVVYTGQGHDHKGLLRKALYVSNNEAHWIREDLQIQVEEKLEVEARIRYRQPLQKAVLYRFEEGYYVVFENDQEAITGGQFTTCYKGSELIFSGVIA